MRYTVSLSGRGDVVSTNDPIAVEVAWLETLRSWLSSGRPTSWGGIMVWSRDTVAPCGCYELGEHELDCREQQPNRRELQWGPGSPTPAMVAAVGVVAGLSGSGAGRLLGVSSRQWRRWLAGECAMPAATYQWLLVATGLHPDYGPRRARR